MIKDFIFTLGLPGSGKSTYINENYVNMFDFAEYLRYSANPLSSTGTEKLTPQEACTDLHYLDIYLANISALRHVDGTWPLKDNQVFVVSADEIKQHLNGFSMDNPQAVHEESVQLARQLVYLFAKTHTMEVNVLMDGGAINNR